MGTLKSPTDYYLGLMTNLLESVYAGGSYRRSESIRDFSYISQRTLTEGLKFLTVALPKLGKALDRGLETGRFVIPEGFKPFRRNSRRPALMQALFKRIFSDDGTILGSPDPYSVQEIRQVCYIFYKMDLPYSDKERGRVLDNFATVERELSSTFVYTDTLIFQRAKSLISAVLKDFDPKNIKPGHGPGAVATGEKGTEKWVFKRKFTSLHQFFPYYEYFIIGGKHELCDRISWYKGLTVEDNPTAKVILVPKDSRGPRLISEEPLEIQFIQQGLLRALVPLIESHPLTRGVVNFRDQRVNQELALESSLTRRVATLDLKDASDRVRLDLVEQLFPSRVVAAFKACRSTHTQLPDGSVLQLSKFAPMGSALCFPVMALTLWALAYAYIESVFNRTNSGPCPHCSVGNLAVYGDDLIVPSEHVSGLVRLLERHSLRVNTDKSFVHGNFRESCGVDAFTGVNVTPFRLRKPWTARRGDTGFLANATALANNLFARGYWRASSYIWADLESRYGFIPFGTSSSGYVSKEVSSVVHAEKLNLRFLHKKRLRWNEDLQRAELRVFSFERRSNPSVTFGSWERMLCDVLTSSASVENSPVRDLSQHNSFVHHTRHASLVKISRRWRRTA